MKDQFDELHSPEALREECRSLLAQLKATQRGCNNARVDELIKLYTETFGESSTPITVDELNTYIDKRTEELK